MKEVKISAGTVIHQAGDAAKSLEYIKSGKIEIKCESFNFSLKAGGIIGILEQSGTPYSYDYIATDDCVLVEYPFSRFSDVNYIVEDYLSSCDSIVASIASMVLSLSSKYRLQKKYSDKFYTTLSDGYLRYKELCGLHRFEVQSFPFLELNSAFNPDKDMPDWVNDYYDQLEIMPSSAKKAFFATHASMTTAYIWEAVSHAKLYLSLCSQISNYLEEVITPYFFSPHADLLDLFNNLLMHNKGDNGINSEVNDAVKKYIDALESNPLLPADKIDEKKNHYKELINATNEAVDDENVGTTEATNISSRYSAIIDSLDTILRYTNTDEAEDERFRTMVSEFKTLKDKNSNNDNVSRLRKDITKAFIDLYESAIISSFEAPSTPTILKMFFYFGYMDEDLIGRENALKLYDMAEKISMAGASNVYTIYDWLKAIYNGQQEPSKNEFDQDYPAFIKSQRASGYITEDMERRYLTSNKEKLRFEIQNFFKTAVRVCSGRPSTYCPILSDHNIIKPLENILASSDKINKNWDVIRAIDYSLFYRPCVFSSAEYHITRESIIQEVLPYVILLPTIGSRALLWQETAGASRNTPARIAMPIFTDDDLLPMQIKLAGEFRWEICKKIQGARWNDISDHSLTSEYFDYLQFYRKNSNLSPDAKEKVKNQISNSRNSFKNVFVADYLLWIKNEALGAPRLNKVSKTILFTYCPFSKAIRERLKTNPMYESLINRHEIKAAKNLKLLKLKYSKLKDSSGSLPPEIIDYITYYDK